jgi:acetyl-CoA acyltransferase
MAFEKNPRDPVIVSAVRTAIGKGGKGTLKNTRPDDLAATVLREAVKRAGVDAASIEDIIIGSATPEAEQGLNVARIAALAADLPESVPAVTVNRFCSSGLETLAMGAQKVMSGWADVVLTGGVESMSMLPMGGHNIRPNPELVEKTPAAYIGMGLTAELVAEQFGVSREDQDAFSLRSHEKALQAIADGKFEEEIVPVQASIFTDDGEQHVEFKVDEGPRPGSTIEGLARLKSPFKQGGSVTAASSSQVSDGAAAVLVMAREKAEALGLPIMGIMRGYKVVGVPPEIMGVGPKYAIPAVLEQTGLSMDDIDVFEVNEAFASQALYCARELGIPDEKLNPNGGAIALGHPLGCTGSRMTATLLHEMKRQGAKYGIVSMCIGGGMGAAGVFEVE